MLRGRLVPCVDVHRLAGSIRSNIPEDVLLHPLISHHRREHRPEGVVYELLFTILC